MEAGSIGASDAATLALLYGGGGGYGGYGRGGGIGVGYGGGGGYGGGMLHAGNSVLAAGAHADGTPIKIALDGHAANNRLGLDTIVGSFENATRDRQFADLSGQHNELELRLADSQAAALAITNDLRAETARNFCDVEKAIAEAAKDAAKCCCDAQLQSCRDHAELKALVISENGATRELIRGDALAAANARITQLETINALSDNKRH